MTRSIFLRMRNVSDKRFRENQNQILSSITFCFQNRDIYEKKWEHIVEKDRPQMTLWRMCILYCKTTATKPHSKYVMLIAFPW